VPRNQRRWLLNAIGSDATAAASQVFAGAGLESFRNLAQVLARGVPFIIVQADATNPGSFTLWGSNTFQFAIASGGLGGAGAVQQAQLTVASLLQSGANVSTMRPIDFRLAPVAVGHGSTAKAAANAATNDPVAALTRSEASQPTVSSLLPSHSDVSNGQGTLANIASAANTYKQVRDSGFLYDASQIAKGVWNWIKGTGARAVNVAESAVPIVEEAGVLAITA
jgi:hypothetical protein